MSKININGKEYKCLDFEHNLSIMIDDKPMRVEHLSIVIEGELDKDTNRLEVEYDNVKHTGAKLIPHYDAGITSFLVYIFQEGDSEALQYE